jgi:hypothetical protein
VGVRVCCAYVRGVDVSEWVGGYHRVTRAAFFARAPAAQVFSHLIFAARGNKASDRSPEGMRRRGAAALFVCSPKILVFSAWSSIGADPKECARRGGTPRCSFIARRSPPAVGCKRPASVEKMVRQSALFRRGWVCLGPPRAAAPNFAIFPKCDRGNGRDKSGRDAEGPHRRRVQTFSLDRKAVVLAVGPAASATGAGAIATPPVQIRPDQNRRLAPLSQRDASQSSRPRLAGKDQPPKASIFAGKLT